MTSETLDDYEEGTFTPAIKFNNANSGMAYNTRVGFYTKVGRLVNFSIRIDLNTKGSSTGDAKIDGLPFTPLSTSGANTGAYPTFITSGANSTWYVQQIFTIDNNSADIELRYLNSAGNYANHNETDFTNSTIIIVAGQFFTA
jgi:hypothetical protein